MWWPDDYEPLIVTGTVIEDGVARPFGYDTRTDEMVYDRYVPLQDPGQRTLTPQEQARIERKLADMIGPDAKVVIGKYVCPDCQRWIQLGERGAWASAKCWQCSLDASSDLHDRYS
ncbi:MAG: hypothetical protein IPM13_18875 [Phycisphaerales bacterium]|nr:hypothetical protein [Phycisphaerales bacterium]